MIPIGNTIRISQIYNKCQLLLNTCKNVPVQNSAACIKTIEERIGLPIKPKKPLTPYFRYMKEIRPSLVAENPNRRVTDICKLVAQKWEHVDEAHKKKLEAEYKIDQVSYLQLRSKYENNLTADQKLDLKVFKQDLAEAKEKRAAKKRIRDLGRPKKPMSGFIKFLSFERKKTPQNNQTYREWQKNASDKWNTMSDNEKEVFNKIPDVEMAKYRQEISKWEEKMVRLGHIDVVRREAMIDPPAPKPKKKIIRE